MSLNLSVLHTGAVKVRLDLRLYICWERVGSRWLRLESLATNIWWSTRSKAFLKSNRAVLTVEPVPSVACSQ